MLSRPGKQTEKAGQGTLKTKSPLKRVEFQGFSLGSHSLKDDMYPERVSGELLYRGTSVGCRGPTFQGHRGRVESAILAAKLALDSSYLSASTV